MNTKTWYETGIEAELKRIEALPHDAKIAKSAAGFFTHLLKIASLTKGGELDPTETLRCIYEASRHLTINNRDREINRQWRNAWKIAKPRHPSDDLPVL